MNRASGAAKIAHSAAATAPVSAAAPTDWPQTLLASDRCRAPTARAMIAVLPAPIAPPIRLTSHSTYATAPTAAVAASASRLRCPAR